MNKEKEYLVKLCSDYLNGNINPMDESIDYSMLFEISNAHNLSPSVFCVMKNAENRGIINSEAYKKFEDDFYNALFRYSLQGGVIDEISALFSKNKIKHIFFKGAELREYYPTPQSRVMGDIDVLISPEARDEARRVLCENGFELINSNGPVWDYKRNSVAIEVHTKIISGKVGSCDAEQYFLNAMEHAEFSGYRGKLDNDYHFAYLLTHIAHHFWFYGAGVKLILDLAAFQRAESIELSAVLERMKEIGLEDFSKVVLSVCKKWFGEGEDFKTDTKTTEEFLTSFGAFGNINRNKAAVVERKELEEGKNLPFFN